MPPVTPNDPNNPINRAVIKENAPVPPPQKSPETSVFTANILILIGYVAVCAFLAAASGQPDLLFASFFISIAHPFVLIFIGLIYVVAGAKPLGKAFLITGFAFIILGPSLSCAANVFLVSGVNMTVL